MGGFRVRSERVAQGRIGRRGSANVRAQRKVARELGIAGCERSRASSMERMTECGMRNHPAQPILPAVSRATESGAALG
jgi:hypothetical protein